MLDAVSAATTKRLSACDQVRPRRRRVPVSIPAAWRPHADGLEALHVKSGLFPAGAVRALALAVPFLGLLSGCDNDDRYSGDLTYPLRADVILVNRPSATPFYPAPPGHVGPLDVKGGERDQAETRNPRALPADDRKEIGGLLAQYFGTPAEPLVGGAYDQLATDVKESVDKLKLEPGHLIEGS